MKNLQKKETGMVNKYKKRCCLASVAQWLGVDL